MWIVASLPLWFIGALLFLLGVFGITKIALNEDPDPAFNNADDCRAMVFCAGMLVVSTILMILAAKVAV